MADDNGSTFLWFLAGLSVGAVLGVLYAPKPGREMRDELRQRAEDGREFVMSRARETAEQAQQWAEQAQQWVEKGREFYEAQKQQVKSAFDAGKEAYRETTRGETPTGQS